MLPLKSFLSEENKNSHIEHLEDEILNRGSVGLSDSINLLQALCNMLAGNTQSKINVSVKWDGSPSIICGKDPESKQFFIATKSAFNKVPKLNFSIYDIYTNHSGELADKLAIAFQHLELLAIEEVLQGDLLYTKNELVFTTIDGVESIAFTPNTITYAVPVNSTLGQRIINSELGIVFHTTYTGTNVVNMSARYSVDISKYKNNNTVWVNDATYHDRSGTITMTTDETAEVNSLLTLCSRQQQKLSSEILDTILSEKGIRRLIKLYNNSKVRAGQPIGNAASHIEGLVIFLDTRYENETEELKTDKGKHNKQLELQRLKNFIQTHITSFIILFEIQNLLTQIKNIIIKKLQTIQSIATFLETDTGYKVTSPEGFIAVNNTGKAVKLIDRLEFSYANFNKQKKWN